MTFEGLLANSRIRDYLRGCVENPVVEILQDLEHKELIQSIPGVLVALQKRYDDLEISLEKKYENLQLSLETRISTLEQSIISVISSKFTGLILSLANHINSTMALA